MLFQKSTLPSSPTIPRGDGFNEALDLGDRGRVAIGDVDRDIRGESIDLHG